MYPRSDLFDVAVRNGAQTRAVVDLLRGGKPVAGMAAIPVASGGTLTADRGQRARRRADITVPDPAWLDALDPYGAELRIRVGFELPNGAEQLIPWAVLGIQQIDDDIPYGGARLLLVDRSKRVADYNFPYPYTPDPGQSAVTVLRALLAEACPWASLQVDPRIRDVMAPQVTWDQSRADAVDEIATALAAEVYASRDGDFVLAPVPTVFDPAVWDASAGSGSVTYRRRSRSSVGVYNGVVTRGSSSTAAAPPAIGNLIVDADRYSPTYWGTGAGADSTFGRRVRRFASPFVQTTEQADAASRAILAQSTGLALSVSFGQARQMALDPGDVVSGIPMGDRTGTHLIERIVCRIGPGLLDCDTRASNADDS